MSGPCIECDAVPRKNRRHRRQNSGSSNRPVQHASDIRDRRQVGEERAEIGQLGVMRIVEPGRDWDRVVGVENVGCRRVVNNDAVMYVAAEL